MRIALCLYSATGNTRHLARALAGELETLGHEVGWVEMLSSPNAPPFDPDGWERVVFAFPVMVFRPPFAVARFLERMKARSVEAPAFALLTCGGMAAHTGRILGEALREKNLRLDGVKEIVCDDSYIPFRKWLPFLLSRGRPGAEEVREARTFARTAAGEAKGPWRAPGGAKRAVFHAMGKRASDREVAGLLGPRHLETGLCIRCGKCARECPSGAITVGEGGVPMVEEALCVGCSACFNNCPVRAWRLTRFDPSYFYRFSGSEEDGE